MAIYDLINTTPSSVEEGDILNCSYSGAKKEIELPAGTYKLEVWGARGGTYNTAYGRGGYSEGILTLDTPSTLYIYAGGMGQGATVGGFNGGGATNRYGGSGGGGSDVRVNGTSFEDRVIVAGGGGGGGYANTPGGHGGGLEGTQGGHGSGTGGLPGTQTAGGSNNTSGIFGMAQANSSNGGAGGGGWYGGASGWSAGTDSAGGGGSGYIGGVTEGITLTGAQSMPAVSGGTQTGHADNGYARITVLSIGGGKTTLNMSFKINGTEKTFDQGWVRVGSALKEIDSMWVRINGTLHEA